VPRLLAVGHVSRDRRPGGDVLGGSVHAYRRPAAGVGGGLTSAGPDFDDREPSASRLSGRLATTRFVNEYDAVDAPPDRDGRGTI
jgi:hypothetical protein